MKESVFGSLAAFLKAENFEGKRRFITEYEGLEFLVRQTCSEEAASYSLKLQKKIMNLVYDFVINDDSIFEHDAFFVRNTLGANTQLMNRLQYIIVNADLENL